LALEGRPFEESFESPLISSPLRRRMRSGPGGSSPDCRLLWPIGAKSYLQNLGTKTGFPCPVSPHTNSHRMSCCHLINEWEIRRYLYTFNKDPSFLEDTRKAPNLFTISLDVGGRGLSGNWRKTFGRELRKPSVL
jgi:hypothetical protein